MKKCRYLKDHYCSVKAKTLAVGRDGDPVECTMCRFRKEKRK